MAGGKSEQVVRELLALADVHVNGPHEWDMQVKDDRLYGRILQDPYLGLGESYMDGWWDCAALDQMIDRVMRAALHLKVKGDWRVMLHLARGRLANLQKPSRAYEVGEKHYDLGNDLYTAMLDERLNYTCGYWRESTDLNSAQ